MTSADFPWEPPIAGTEQEHLFGALDRLRTTFRWKADGLDDKGLRATVRSIHFDDRVAAEAPRLR